MYAHLEQRQTRCTRLSYILSYKTNKKRHPGVTGNMRRGSRVWWNNHREPSLLREWTINPGPIHSAAFNSTQEIKYLPRVGLLKRHDIFKGPTVQPWHEPNTYLLSLGGKKRVLFVWRCKKKKFCYLKTEISICQYWYFQFSSSTSIFWCAL